MDIFFDPDLLQAWQLGKGSGKAFRVWSTTRKTKGLRLVLSGPAGQVTLFLAPDQVQAVKRALDGEDVTVFQNEGSKSAEAV